MSDWLDCLIYQLTGGKLAWITDIKPNDYLIILRRSVYNHNLKTWDLTMKTDDAQ